MRIPTGLMRKRRRELKALRKQGIRRRDVIVAARELKKEGLWNKDRPDEMAELLSAELVLGAPGRAGLGFDIVAIIALIELLMPLIERFMEGCDEED